MCNPINPSSNAAILKKQRIAAIIKVIQDMPDVNSVEIEGEYVQHTSSGVNTLTRLIVYYPGLNDEPLIVEVY